MQATDVTRTAAKATAAAVAVVALAFGLWKVRSIVILLLLALSEALHQGGPAATPSHSTGVRHDVLAWVDRQFRELPHGSKLFHPIAAYGHKATSAVVATFFTLAATWYWVSERDRMIELLAAIAPESKR